MTHGDPKNSCLVDLVAGARPNFMKVAPLWHELRRRPWCRLRLVHTGQHYDASMSDAFFHDLRLPPPDCYLGIGSGSHAEQTGGVMVAYERICMAERPDWVVVVGDINSTLACALAAKKLALKVAHLEAGLRSRDWTMPEEINRVVTDRLADLLWTPSPDADVNLLQEGVAPARIERVGNIMIDTLEMLRPLIEMDRSAADLGLLGLRFGVVTLHRPSNTDDREKLVSLVEALSEAARLLPLVFPVHPRTRARLVEFELVPRLEAAGVRLTEPLGYVAFMGLVCRAALVITDSGGIQEETTYLGVPCLTTRETTERPITVTQGTNRLVRPEQLVESVRVGLAADQPRQVPPALWDGRTAARVADSLVRVSGVQNAEVLR